LWVDTFNGYFESPNVLAAVKVLQAAGFTVHIPQKKWGHYCCGRTYLSTGMYEKAQTAAKELIHLLHSFTELGIPIVGLEPSCVLGLRDEYLVMGFGNLAHQVAHNTFMFEEFLAKELANGTLKLNLEDAQYPLLVHGHCHQKAFDVVNHLLTLLKTIPKAQIKFIETSCCGMAGSFGYESEHADISMQMAELELLPAIRNSKDAIIVADGTSCRHQILAGADRKAIHVAQVLAMHLKDQPQTSYTKPTIGM
jgi:Fe-S oxidoreductase